MKVTKPTKTNTRFEAGTLLASKGLRVTEQRITVLEALSTCKAPVSHPELAQMLLKHGLDRATVYRSLLSLEEAGLVLKTQLGDNVWRFELFQEGSQVHKEHAHFVCTTCGDVSCLPRAAVKFVGDAMKIKVEEIQVRGQCTQCA